MQVKAVTIFRDPRTGGSKGCGLTTMATRAQAEAALAALNDQLHIEVLRLLSCDLTGCSMRLYVACTWVPG